MDETPPEATPEPGAGLMLRGSRWRGGDVGATVDLADGRTLWLFGDSFIADEGVDTRRGSHFVHSSIAVQTGLDPTAATVEFRWGEEVDGRPQDYFPQHDVWHYRWPGHGVRIGDAVLVFLMEIGPAVDEPPMASTPAEA